MKAAEHEHEVPVTIEVTIEVGKPGLTDSDAAATVGDTLGEILAEYCDRSGWGPTERARLYMGLTKLFPVFDDDGREPSDD